MKDEFRHYQTQLLFPIFFCLPVLDSFLLVYRLPWSSRRLQFVHVHLFVAMESAFQDGGLVDKKKGSKKRNRRSMSEIHCLWLNILHLNGTKIYVYLPATNHSLLAVVLFHGFGFSAMLYVTFSESQ